MKKENLHRAYEPLPDALDARVRSSLAQLEEEKRPARKVRLRTVAIALAIVLALGGAAYAILESQTANVFGWFYGPDKKDELLGGDIAPIAQSCQVGDVIYTIDEVIWSKGVLYGTGHITAAQGANIVLIAEDYTPDEVAGYLLHEGSEEIPDDAKTYAQRAEETGGRIIHAHVSPEGYEKNGVLTHGDIGRLSYPQKDGSIDFFFEMYGEYEDQKETDIPRGERYELHFTLHNWEVTRQGQWLREEPNNTWEKKERTISVVPMVKGE